MDRFFGQSDEVKLRVSRFPVPYAALSWDDIDQSDDMVADAVQRCWDFIEGWEDNPSGPERGLVFVGPPGRGKTMLAALTLREVMIHHRRRGAFIAAADLIAMSMLAMNPDRADPDDTKFLDECFDPSYVKCLVIDDLAKEHRGASDWAKNELNRLIRRRYMGGACTLVTSNLLAKEWEMIYGEATASFLHQAFDKIELSMSADMRLRRY